MMKMPVPLNPVIPMLDVNMNPTVVRMMMLVPMIGAIHLMVANMKMLTVMTTIVYRRFL